jgi:predicted metal-dependent peptidase
MNIKHQKIAEAISSLTFSHPFFASVLLQLEIVEDYYCDTFWVDGLTLGYNPDYADSLNFEENKGVLAHEVMHVVLLHFGRMNGRDLETWNKATDYVINWQLVRSNFTLPKGALLDRKYSNCNAEDAYRMLMEEKQEKEESEDGESDDKQDSGSQSDSNSNSNEGEEGDDSSSGNSSDEGSESDSKESGNGNGSSQNDKPSKSFEGNFGEVRAPKESDKNTLEEKAALIAKFAESAAKLCGTLPAGMQRLLEDARKPKYDWREILNRFLNEVAAKDYSFMRANKRHLGRGIILPSLYSKTIGKVVIAVDTSGSVTDEEVNKLLAEVTAMLDMINESKGAAEIEIIYCDAVICGVETYDGTKKFNPKGGGGTDFAPVFKYIEDNDLNPDCFIYISDGYCDSFGSIVPDYPTLWAITVSYNDFRPPFGEKFILDIHGI